MFIRFLYRWVSLFAIIGIVSTDLWAGENTSSALEKMDAVPPSFWTQDTLTGQWDGVRPKLADHGITITPTWTNDVFDNPTGGFRQGGVDDGLFTLALDVDTAKLTGWPEGGIFHVNFLYLYGSIIDGQDVGDFSTISNISGFNTFRMQECWYQQSFLDQKVNLKLGWIAVDTEFFTSSTASLFIDSAFGAFPLLALNDSSNPPIYPIASPGVRFAIHPTPQIYAQAGLFSGDPGSQVENSNGFDFRIEGRSGLFTINEVGYLLNQEPKDKGLQGTYKLGSFLKAGQFDTWDSQTAHALAGILPQEEGTDFGIYGVIDQQVFKSEDRLVSLFTRAGYAPTNINIVAPYVDGGFNFTGFIPSRDKDVFGIAATRSWISDSYSSYSQSVNGLPHLTAETVFETTYRFQIAPWWTIQPDLQYVFQPGGAANAHDALVLGIRTSVSF